MLGSARPLAAALAVLAAGAALAAGCDLHDWVPETGTSSGSGGSTSTTDTASPTSTSGTGGAGAATTAGGDGGTGAATSSATTGGSGGEPPASSSSSSGSGGAGGGPTCPDTKTVYCGGKVPNGLHPEGSALKLYTCQDGVFTESQTCALGCVAAGPGVDDACHPGSTCPLGTGGYCGQHLVGGSPFEAYCCDNGKLTLHKACNGGDLCVQKEPGYNDCCPEEMSGGLCPENDVVCP